MKKILSFLQKKPLALAAVALFSMSSFADEPVTDQVWTKVTDGTSLKAFDYVTFVDVNAKKVYNGFKHAVKYEGENPGSEGTGFWVVDGWAPEEGSPVAADYPESSWAFRVEDEEAEGPLFTYFTEDAEVTGRDLNSLVSWDKDLISDGYVKSLASKRYVYYDKTAGYFWTKPEPDKVGLYKQTELARPVFDPTSRTIWVNPEAPAGPSINISIPGIGKNDPVGDIFYKIGEGTYGEKGYGTSTDVTPEYEDGVPVKITAKNVYEGGETKEVTETYTFVSIELPYFDPETGIKIANDGTAKVEIFDDTEGAAIKYYVAEKGKEPEEPTFEDYSKALDLAEYVGKTVVVYAKATKGGAETSVVSAEYTIEPNATAEDLELELNADPKEGSEVGGGDIITLWWTSNSDEYDYYTLAPNPEVTELELTFHTADGEATEVVKTVVKNGKVTFKAPGKPAYYNTEFDVNVPEGFYLATSGANVIETPEALVAYKMGLGSSDFVIDPETTWQPSDKNTIVIRVYPRNNEEAVVDFANPSQEESNYGAQFTDAESKVVTEITKVEKITTDEEGNELPNTFEITFENEEGQAQFIKDYLINYDGMLEFAGYSVGFPAGTFKTDVYVNGEKLNHHVKFYDSVELTIEPLAWTRCEGSQGVEVFIKAIGKVVYPKEMQKEGHKYTEEGREIYNQPFDSEHPSQVNFDENAVVTVTGTDIHGDEVNETAKIEVARESLQKKWNSKDVFYLTYGEFTLQEDGGDGTKDGNKPYLVSIPEGAFSVHYDSTDAFEGKLDVMAHPVWTATARPYSYDEGKKSTSTLTLDLRATLNDLKKETDDHVKLFERSVEVFDPEVEITVDGVAAKSWTLSNVTIPDFDEDDRPYEDFVVTLELAEPIADVAKHEIVIGESAFIANACDNKKIELDVQPKVTYEIEQIKYIIPTDQESVTYEIWGILPDGSKVQAPIDYVGETDPEARTLFNALRYNDAHYADVDEKETEGQQSILDGVWFYPEVAGTQYNEDKATTTFTISFPDGLIQGYYKMNFPAGTVQAQGYNENDARLFDPFDVVPAFVYDATSSEEDYNQPGKYPKEKEYNISTKTTEITLYLTAENPDDEYTNNANSDILLKEGTKLGFAEGIIDDEADSEVGKFTWKKVVDGIFTVTFDALQPGQYTLVVPSHSVTTKSIDKILDEGTALNTDNPEAFFLTINVEDFAGPTDQPIEITTKTWEFDVPLSEGKVTEVNEDAEVWLVDDNGNGMPVELSKTDETTLHVTLTYDEEKEQYNFLHSTPFPPKSPYLVKGAGVDADADADADAEEEGLYTLIVPAGAFTGKYATTYEDLTVKVKVIYEFVDSNTGVKDGEDNDLVTTEMEVGRETGEHEKIYFTRKFANDRFQGFAVPFDVKQADVADYFTIYRIQTVTVEEGANGKDVFKLNFVPVGEEGKAFANKPYIIKAKQTSNDTVRIALDKAVTYVEYPEVADDIKASTTLMRFDFKNTIKEQDGSKDLLTIGWDAEYNKPNVGNTEGQTIPAWRWFMETSAKSDEPFYIKIAINGVDVDATGIDFVDAAEGDNLIFNVAGQKLNTTAKGKVNIINGKKVLVK